MPNRQHVILETNYRLFGPQLRHQTWRALWWLDQIIYGFNELLLH